MRHPVAPVALTLLVVSAMAAAPAQVAFGATAHSSAKAVASCPTDSDTLFANGDIDNDNRSDTVVGVPSATVDGQAGAGVIDVTLSSGARQRIPSDDNPSEGDHFGASVALGDLLPNGGCASVAVGAPGTSGSNGAVYVFAGTGAGLSTTSGQILTAHEVGDQFGTSMAVADDGVYVGAPGATVNGQKGAGAVYFFAFPFVGDSVSPTHTITQNTAGVPGVAEAGDAFGSSIAWTPKGLFVGSPGESNGSLKNAGNVIYLNGAVPTTAYAWTQNAPGVPGTSEAGDRFGAALAASGDSRNEAGEVIVGVPGEDIGQVKDAGAVQLFALDATRTAFVPKSSFDQNRKGVPGAAETGDQFGSAVTFGFQFTCTGATEFFPAVGAPGEDVGTVKNAGSVTVLGGTHFSCPSQAFTEGTGGLGGTVQTGARVGATVSARSDSWLDDSDGEDTSDVLLVGAPGQKVGSVIGAGTVIEMRPNPDDQAMLTRLTDSGGTKSGEGYGAALAHSSS